MGTSRTLNEVEWNLERRRELSLSTDHILEFRRTKLENVNPGRRPGWFVRKGGDKPVLLFMTMR